MSGSSPCNFFVHSNLSPFPPSLTLGKGVKTQKYLSRGFRPRERYFCVYFPSPAFGGGAGVGVLNNPHLLAHLGEDFQHLGKLLIGVSGHVAGA